MEEDMADSSHRTTIIAAVIGVIRSIVVALVTNLDKFADSSNRMATPSIQLSTPAHTSTVQTSKRVTPPRDDVASVLSIAGSWRDPNIPGNGSCITQEGSSFQVRAEAKGVQIYKSVEGKDGRLEWIPEAPLADLFNSEGKKVGTHYEGPSWEAMDGSKVIRDKEQAVKMAAAPNANADIPWL
jgi:Protein of unknown function (DUF3455)